MKLPARVFVSSGLLGFIFYPAVMTGMYAWHGSGGSESLSNVTVNEGYSALVADPKAAALTLSPPESQPRPEPLKRQPILAKQPILVKKARFDQMVAEVARTHGLDGALLHAVISVESHYNPNAVSRTGAVGLMQLMPATAKRYGVTDSFDPAQNLHGGAKYLRDLLILFNSDISLVLAAYNAGEYAVIRNGNRIPPYPETRDYVPRVMGYYHQYQVKL